MKEEFPTLLITKETPLAKVKDLTKNNCGGCKHCCSYDSPLMLKDDIKRISKHLELPEEKFKQDYLEEHERFNTKTYRVRQTQTGDLPKGTCTFFNNQEGCTLKGKRPLHCQIGNCNEHGSQVMTWFNLNYFVNKNDPKSIREWATHIQLKPTIPGGELHQLIPEKKKLKDILEYKDLNREPPKL